MFVGTEETDEGESFLCCDCRSNLLNAHDLYAEYVLFLNLYFPDTTLSPCCIDAASAERAGAVAIVSFF